MNVAVLISSFLLGIGGSLHCLGMCGPLALSIPFGATGNSKNLRLLTYYFSKAIAYGFMGAVFGLFGKGLIMMHWQQALSIVAGIFIVLWVCFPILKPGQGSFLFQKQFSILHNKLQYQPKLHYYLLLGFLNGFLPCGLVYTALAAATVSGSPAGGFLAMFLFGMGTAPALFVLVLLKNKMSFQLRRKLKPISLVLSIGIGLLLIIRGLNLGIPYVSPEITKDDTVEKCCHK
jgi:uncharacterized protein